MISVIYVNSENYHFFLNSAHPIGPLMNLLHEEGHVGKLDELRGNKRVCLVTYTQ